MVSPARLDYNSHEPLGENGYHSGQVRGFLEIVRRSSKLCSAVPRVGRTATNFLNRVFLLFSEGLPSDRELGGGDFQCRTAGVPPAGGSRALYTLRPVLTACRKSVSSFLRFLHLAAASLFRSRLTRRRSSSSGLIWRVEGAVRWTLGHWLPRTRLLRGAVVGPWRRARQRGGAPSMRFRDHLTPTVPCTHALGTINQVSSSHLAFAFFDSSLGMPHLHSKKLNPALLPGLN